MVTFSQRPEDDNSQFNTQEVDFDAEKPEQADPTLNVAPQQPSTSPAFQHLLGNAFFREDASLALYFQGKAEPLVIQPPAQLAIGRSDNNPMEIPLLDLVPYGAREGGVSRFHALFHRSRRTLAIEDMDSTNGTFINGQWLKPHESQVLHDGDEISLGRLVIQIQFQQ